MKYLLDTNVISELQKGKRANPAVLDWFAMVETEDLFLSVLVVAELKIGVELMRRKDAQQATVLSSRLAGIYALFDNRILPITASIANAWAELNVPDRLATIDGLIAATAKVHQLTLVTRNTKDVARTGVSLLNPFVESE